MIERNLNILNGFVILYLEDDKSLLRHTKDTLDDFVQKVFAVSNSSQALEVLQSNHVDIIISDILLEDENGIDFLKHIKNELEINIPIILTTAHTDTKYLLEAIKLKVENYIVKPINIKELLNTIHDILVPIIQKQEIRKNSKIIKTISNISDGKQVEVIKYIVNNLDDKNTLVTSYGDIMEIISISKPTLIKLFRELSEKNILVKTAHKTYKFNDEAL